MGEVGEVEYLRKESGEGEDDVEAGDAAAEAGDEETEDEEESVGLAMLSRSYEFDCAVPLSKLIWSMRSEVASRSDPRREDVLINVDSIV